MPVLNVIFTVIVFALILSFLVIIHELGHFFAARWRKVKVEEFGLGYPPLAKKLFSWKGTLFTLNWVPFGGFVKLEGENGPEEPEATAQKKKSKNSDAFYEKSVLSRLIIILAGVTVNFLFGVIAFATVFSISGIPSGGIIGEVNPGSPAESVGLKPGVAITSVVVDGVTTPTRGSWEAVNVIRANPGKQANITTTGPCQDARCEETGQTYSVYLRRPDEIPEGQGSLGITFQQDYFKFYPWYEQPIRGTLLGLEQAVGMGQQILVALGDMVKTGLTQGRVPTEVSGPVGIVHEAQRSQLFTQGPLVLLMFAGMLSINLAIMNVLPLPALDGGRVVLILLETVIGRARVERFEGAVNYAGFAFLILLIVLVTLKDIGALILG